MKHDDALTATEHRPISDQEAAVVAWLLNNALVNDTFQQDFDGIHRLRVVGRCTCGCASVDFTRDGQSNACRPIADAIAQLASGLKCGVILWGRDDEVTGREIYEMDPGTTNDLPSLEMLRPWHAA